MHKSLCLFTIFLDLNFIPQYVIFLTAMTFKMNKFLKNLNCLFSLKNVTFKECGEVALVALYQFTRKSFKFPLFGLQINSH